MKLNSSKISKFVTNYCTLDNIQNIHQSCVEINSGVAGFKRLEMKASKFVHYTSYCRQRAEPLNEQVAICTREQLDWNFGAQNFTSNFLKAKIGKMPVPQYKKLISLLRMKMCVEKQLRRMELCLCLCA